MKAIKLAASVAKKLVKIDFHNRPEYIDKTQSLTFDIVKVDITDDLEIKIEFNDIRVGGGLWAASSVKEISHSPYPPNKGRCD